MNHLEAINFLDHISEYTEEQIIANMPYINSCLRNIGWLQCDTSYLESLFKVVDKNKLLYELFKDENKFSYWKEQLDFPQRLKFGVEIEVAELTFKEIKYFFENNYISTIMGILEIPDDITNSIVQNSDFKKKNAFTKWIFSPELLLNMSEASSPIMENNLSDLNQIVAICTLLKALDAKLNGGTGLHINVGVDYLECNEKAIENLLKIWGECEELFYKIANPEGEVIRIEARTSAKPIKGNIQDFLEEDGSITLNTEEDMEKFLYKIQAKNRMIQIVNFSRSDIERDLHDAKTEEEKFQIYRRYEQWLRDKGGNNSAVKHTSINFNHMKWNEDNPGRIEVRIFNSSLEPEIIFQDLLLVGKIFEASLENAKNPGYKKDVFDKLFLRDVTETRKVNNLLNLLFDNPEQRKIFKNRWKSVRREKRYKEFRSGKDTFER